MREQSVGYSRARWGEATPSEPNRASGNDPNAKQAPNTQQPVGAVSFTRASNVRRKHSSCWQIRAHLVTVMVAWMG